jgi:hypothetical protein
MAVGLSIVEPRVRKAIGLLALCRILFGGFGFGGGPRSHARRRMAERWERMTPEEREAFRQGLHGRGGSAAPLDPTLGV